MTKTNDISAIELEGDLPIAPHHAPGTPVRVMVRGHIEPGVVRSCIYALDRDYRLIVDGPNGCVWRGAAPECILPAA